MTEHSEKPSLLKTLLDEREHLKARNAVIAAKMPTLPAKSVERFNLVGEQTSNNLRLKHLRSLIADEQRKLNGASPVAAFAREHFRKAAEEKLLEPVPGDSIFASSLSKRQVTALASMHAIITTVFRGHTVGAIEDSAENIAEAAWAITDAMFSPPAEEDDDYKDEEDS